MTKHFKRILLGICIGVIGIAVYQTPQGRLLEEEYGLYWLFQLRGTIPAPNEVIVVAADRPSAIQMGLPANPRFWPWPRDYHARLIEQLAQAGAAIIVLDLIFDSPGPEPEHDRVLAEAIEKAGNVILVERLSAAPPENADALQLQIIQHRRIAPLPEIAAATLSHVPFPLPRIPRINAYWAFKADAGDFPTMPIVALQAFSLGVYDDFIALLQEIENFDTASLPSHKEQITDLESLILNLREKFVNHPEVKDQLLSELRKNDRLDDHTKHIIQVLTNLYSNQPYHYLNFYGPPRTIHTVPYHQILLPNDTDANALQSLPGAIKGKAVFVGLSAATQSEQDIIRDSYHTVFTESEGRQIDGVEIAATAFANLLENKPVNPFPHEGSLGLLFVMGLTLGFIFPSLSYKALIATSVAITSAYTVFSWLLFKQAGVWLPLVTPLFVVIPSAMVGAIILKYLTAKLMHKQAQQQRDQARQERDQLLALFGPYSPEQVIGDMTRRIDASMLENRDSFAACLSTDIAGYAALAEKMDPQQVSLMLENYFSVLYQCVRQNNGIVNDRIGDGMLAVWEVTDDKEAIHKQVCEAGLAIKKSIDQFNSESNYPALPTRIGIHFGKLLITRFAFDTNRNHIYRVIGNLVNTTSRIESVNKQLGTTLLVTRDVLKGTNHFFTRPLGHFRLKGLSRPVQLVELVTHKQKTSPEQIVLCEMFSDALNAYLLQQHAAIQKWAHILKQFPGDGPTKFYLNVCTQSPPNQWKPVIEFTEK